MHCSAAQVHYGDLIQRDPKGVLDLDLAKRAATLLVRTMPHCEDQTELKKARDPSVLHGIARSDFVAQMAQCPAQTEHLVYRNSDLAETECPVAIVDHWSIPRAHYVTILETARFDCDGNLAQQVQKWALRDDLLVLSEEEVCQGPRVLHGAVIYLLS